jgi:hypothetical protein
MKSERQIIELAKKLKALSERGVGGEAINSEEALQRLIKKYKIDISLLSSEDPTQREIKFDARIPMNKDLSAQIIWRLLEDSENPDRSLRSRKRRTKYGILYIDLTEAEYLEVVMRIEHYQADFKKNIDAFLYAYMKRQDLLTKPSETSRDLTEEEKERLKMADRHQWGIAKNSPTKRLK